jgi:ABC-type microcin C transport system permease subunit YejE
MPLVFAVLAFGSGHPRWPGAVLRAMGLFIVLGLPLAAWSVIVGVAAGYAAGAVTAMRPMDEIEDVGKARTIAAAVITLYLAILLAVAPGFAVVSAAVLPFAAIAFADQVTETRAATSNGADSHT